MTAPETPRRSFVLAAASVVMLLTSIVVVNATSTFTVPNATTISYNLAAGAVSSPITPSAGKPVFVMGTQNSIGNRGVGQVTLQVPSVDPKFVEWTGIESPAAAAITSGFSATAGTHIVYLDYGHTIDIEVASATTIQVRNGSASPATGVVTLIW